MSTTYASVTPSFDHFFSLREREESEGEGLVCILIASSACCNG